MHCYQRKPKTLLRYLYNETQIVFAFALVVLSIYCLENLVSYNAEGTNTFSIKSHNLRIWLGDEALATISNKQANWLCILVQISTDKTLHRTQEMKVLRQVDLHQVLRYKLPQTLTLGGPKKLQI